MLGLPLLVLRLLKRTAAHPQSCALVAGHIRLLQVPEALSKEASQGKSLTRLVTRVTGVTRGIGFPNSLLSLLGVARWIRWGMTLPGVIPKISAPQVLSKYPVLCEYLEPWPEKKNINWTLRNDSNWVFGKSLLNKFADVFPHCGGLNTACSKKKELG